MTPTEIFYLILAFIVFEFVLEKTIGYLNTTYWSHKIPKELKGIYDEEKYAQSQKYEKEKYVFGLITSSFSFLILMGALIFGFFGWLDMSLREVIQNDILISVVFFLILMGIQSLISIPFDYYGTFVIEEKYGFNKSTVSLFLLDALKSVFLLFLLGGILLSLITYLYHKAGPNFWLYTWGVITFFSIFMLMFYSNIIVPLFNKQTPLEDGELKTAIQKFAKKVGFQLDNIFVIDGSKRSSKANAYFTGLWKKKRIVLYDTLIQDLSTEEIVAVLAHEIGHYKRKHTLQMLTFSIVQTGAMMYILSLALSVPEVSYALGTNIQSFHMGAFTFSILFTPLSIILGILGNMLSRKNEYEADAYAKEHFGAKHLQSALRKLSINNLSNLRPHPVYEFFHYSHPTVLKRLQAMND